MQSSSDPSANKTVCMFCGSSPGTDPAYLEVARVFGELIGEKGWRLVYGGGATGLMGEAARAALAAGAEVIGVRPTPLDHLERPQGGIAMIHTPDLFERKQRMIAMSDAFVILAGGLGTLDEFFEVVTTAQLGMHEKPILLVNTNNYFAPLFALLQHCGTQGFIYRDVSRLIHVVRSAEEAIALL
ncbi:MAG TPA: TIGR00730 family Rossman fold protein [Rhizomicrobium sp.]|nr:TIGR00730 family Rossman fold protein [Rhizomicrobium sp.]